MSKAKATAVEREKFVRSVGEKTWPKELEVPGWTEQVVVGSIDRYVLALLTPRPFARPEIYLPEHQTPCESPFGKPYLYSNTFTM